jgi:hypothetical protein
MDLIKRSSANQAIRQPNPDTLTNLDETLQHPSYTLDFLVPLKTFLFDETGHVLDLSVVSRVSQSLQVLTSLSLTHIIRRYRYTQSLKLGKEVPLQRGRR